jgi:ubiquitin-protein ligase
MDLRPDDLRRSFKRLTTEHQQLKKDNDCLWFRAEPCKDAVGENSNVYKWDIEMYGQEGTPYDGYIMKAEMVFPVDYPLSPPKLRFTTPMFHPNIYKDGLVCISILHTGTEPFLTESPKDQWTPVQSIRTIIVSLTALLHDPNPDSPANVDASKTYRASKEEYERQVKELLEKSCEKMSGRPDMKKAPANETGGSPAERKRSPKGNN